MYAKLLQMEPAECEIYLLEYDTRFKVYGENVVFYDYSRPLDLPKSLGEQSFDVVLADPPYLSRECLEKTAQTVRFLANKKIILCTGERVRSSANMHVCTLP